MAKYAVVRCNFLAAGNFDGKALKAYKSTKAFSYYKDGWVKTCLYHDISERSKFCYIRANVLPSFKLNEKHHKTWVLLENEIGSICSAGCTCIAGLGQCCNHVAALLFKIDDAIKLGCNSLTCTSMYQPPPHFSIYFNETF